MSTQRDPRAVAHSSKAGKAPQHEPRIPDDQTDDAATHTDHPGKPFRTPNKTKTHAAPEQATDGNPKPRSN